ncbi:hypothetical protein BD769DRAFT_1669258 [Suillus cothurnatus]|nr:hypothetical protein BD769DRAFT_1669258 [Suillus cothurnatus]
MVPQIHTPVPVKPLPLPATIEDRLDRLVAQHFLELSQNVLAPGLKHAVDALVPSIVEQLTDGLSDGLRASIHPWPPIRKTDISSDTQSSDDEDGLKPHLRRKCPEIALEHRGGNLLAIDFQMKVKSGIYSKVVFNDETMNLDNLRLFTFSNLEDMDHASHEMSAQNERRQRLDWSNTRKHGTLQRCRKIVEQNHHQNPETWDMIMRVIERLNIDGMSGNETDTPPGVIPKVTRRVGLPWLSPDITQLLHAVESFMPATYKENMTVPTGNSSLPCILEQKRMAHNSIVIQKLLRILEQKRTAHNSIVIQKLPRNWYDDTWYKANSSSARAFLDVCKAFNIPHLEPYHSRS